MTTSFIETWDETKPAGSRQKALGDDDIREFKRAFRERFGEDHIAAADESAETQIGRHRKVSFAEVQTSDPTNEANVGFLYLKDVDDVVELFWEDESGNVKQLTTAGALNIAATEAVLLTGNQTIAGEKTFSNNINLGSGITIDGRDPSADGSKLDDITASAKNVGCRSGTVGNGATIPLPSGFTEAQCTWTVSMRRSNPNGTTWDWNENAAHNHIRQYCYANASRVVSCYTEYNNNDDTTITVSGEANYLIIGVK